MYYVDVANNLTTLIFTILGILTIFIGFIAWFIRLESKVLYLEKDHEAHKDSVAKKDEAIWAKLDGLQATTNQVLQLVGELKGKIEK